MEDMQVCRRNFLKMMGLVAASNSGLAGCGHLRNLFSDPENFTDRVVIIGGGLAGLSLAYELKQKKVPYCIFEANPRWGGRIHTMKQFGKNAMPIELGAEWIDDSDTYVLDYLKKLGLKTKNGKIIDGSEKLIQVLLGRIESPMSGYNKVNEHELIRIENIDDISYITFKTPHKERLIVARKVVLAMPPHLLQKIKGLDVYFRSENIVLQNKIKVFYETSQLKIKNSQLTYREVPLYLSETLENNSAQIWSGLVDEESIKQWNEDTLNQISLVKKFVKKNKSQTLSFMSHNWALKPWSKISHVKLLDSERIQAQLPKNLFVAGDAYSSASSMNGALQSTYRTLQNL